MIKKINWQFLLQESLLILLLSYLLLIGSTHNGLVNGTILTISASLFSLLGVYWIFKGAPERNPLEWPLVAFLIILAITSMTSIDPRRSISEFWLICISALLFITTGDFIRRGLPKDMVFKTILIIGSMIMFFGWLEAFQWYSNWVRITGDPIPDTNFRLSTPNFFVVILNAFMMCAAALLFFQKSWLNRIICGLYILSAVGLIFLTSSRGGWLGTLAGSGCLAAVLFYQFSGETAKAWDYLRKNKLILTGLSLALAAAGGAAGFMLYRQAMHPTHSQSIIGARSYLWNPAWQAFLRSPLVGEGPFTYVSQYARVRSVPPHEIFVYSHNIYLDFLSGSGIIGLAALLWLAGAAAVVLIKKIRISKDNEKVIAMGVLATLAAILMHGLLDSVHHTIPTSAWTIAILMGTAIFPKNTTKKPSLPAICIGMAVIFLSWINVWQNAPLEKGVRSTISGDWANARNKFKDAAARDPRMAIAWKQLGLAESQLAFEENRNDLQGAIQAFEKTVQLDPNWAVNHANLAALYHANGDVEKAVSEYKIALEKAPLSTVILLNYGEILEENGDLQGAREMYTKAITLGPDLVQAYFWRENAFRQEIADNWMGSHPEPEETETVDLEKALQADPKTAAGYIPLIDRTIREGKLDKAEDLLKRVEFTYFQNEKEHLEIRWLEAEMLAKKGDYSNAILKGEDALNGFRNQGMYGPGTYGRSMYSEIMFRRLSVAMDWVPQITIIKITDRWGGKMAQLAEWYERDGDQAGSNRVLKELLQAIPDYADNKATDE